MVDSELGLDVLPGVEIVLTTDSSRLWLAGHCSLIGTESDSIVVTLNASHSQFRSYRANTYSIELEYCKIVTTGGAGVALLADSVNISHTSSVGMEHPFNDAFIRADVVKLTNSHFASLDVVCDSASLSNCTFEYSVRFEDGSVSIDSLFAIGEYADFTYITLWPSGANRRLNVSKVRCGSMNLDGTFSPGAQANLTEITATERLGNSIYLAIFSSYSISNCSVNRVYNWLSSGTIERSKLYSFAIENTSQVVTISNCVFEIKECCREDYPHGFITGTVTTDFSLYNNIFVSGDSLLPVVYYPTNDVIDARYNITVGMEDPWRGIVEGCCNFSASNLFDPHSNYGLRFDSPAINSGRLGQPDEDGSRSDIGIDWWDHRYDHPPTITTPDTLEARWGDQFTFVLSATDEGPVTFPILPRGPWWLTGPIRLDEVRDTLFDGTIPFGIDSFDVVLSARDRIGQFDSESIHVKVYPQSVLLDTVRGILTIEHSPYRFFRDIVIPYGDTLRVDPGVVILADSLTCSPTIHVYGTLIAAGSMTDSIHFMSFAENRWGGLLCHSGSGIILDYVSIQKAEQALYSNEAVVMQIEHSTITSPSAYNDLYFSNALCSILVTKINFLNGARFGVTGSIFTLDSSLFDGNGITDVAGIVYVNESPGLIAACRFTDLATYPLQIQSADLIIEHCVFDDIQSSRMIVSSTWGLTGPTIQHNTFIGNGSQYVVGFVPNSSIVIRNNIFVDFTRLMRVFSFDTDTSSIVIQNNCFWNVNEIVDQDCLYWPTIGQMIGINANGDSVDLYNNLRSDPEFQDSSFRLSLNSPCINAGVEYGQVFYGEAPDIGAFEFGVSFSPENRSLLAPSRFGLSVFPNPFNPTTTLSFALPKLSDVELTVFDVLGRVVMSRELGRLNAGEHQVAIDGAEWSSGVYFARLSAGGVGKVVKMALIR